MPLPQSAERELMHTRSIELRGYRRADGLWDIEGHLTDVKSYSFDNQWRGVVKAGEPLHDMWLRLTLDEDFVVRDVAASTDRSPYPECPAITQAFRVLIGEKIASGWTNRTRELLGGVKGCTHLVELLGPIATTAFQTMWPLRARKADAVAPGGRRPRPGLIDTCHALAADGPVVERTWPEFHLKRPGAA
ncbi:MAG: DUF2889 domain-containing protein [Thalassobaculales bacterium]